MLAHVETTIITGRSLPPDVCDEVARFIRRNLQKDVTANDIARCHVVVLARCKFTTSLVAAVVVKKTHVGNARSTHEIDWLCVSSNYRGNGIGGRLLARLTASMPNGSFLRVYFETHPGNERAYFCYQAQGFTVAYQNEYETCLQLEVRRPEHGVAVLTAVSLAGLVTAVMVRMGFRLWWGLFRRVSW
tara:strand:+ start:220 stop:783 length:564 start_codon:yes stop_codon:yes gene_type:complete